MTRAAAAAALVWLLAAAAFAPTTIATATGDEDGDAGFARDDRTIEELSSQVRALLSAGSMDGGLASIPPPPALVETLTPSLTPGANVAPTSSAPPPAPPGSEPPATPVPSPTPTPTPTPTAEPPLPPPTSTPPAGTPPAGTPPAATLNPTPITPEPTTSTPPDTTTPPPSVPEPSTTPPASDEAPEPTETPSPTPKRNIIFNIQIVDDSAKKYVRSDKDASTPSASLSGGASSATSAADKEKRDGDSDGGETSTVSSSTSTTSRVNNVIGGRTRDNPVNAIAMSKDAAAFHDAVRYASCTVAGISVALLLFFHYVSLDPSVDWSTRSAGLLWAPNTWEFVVYLGYLQQMGSLSQLDLPRTPYILWDYTDAFSWSCFLIRNSGAASLSRRLEAVVLTGIVAFGDRIGVEENSLLFLCSLAFLFVFSALFIVYVAIVLLAKRKAEKFDAIDNYSVIDPSKGGVYGLRFVSLRFLGLCVLIWLFALYPLSLFSAFEISMQVDSHVVSAGSLVLAITVLGVACFGVLFQTARELYRKSDGELADAKNLAVWGSLYAAYTYRRRLFFLVVALVQVGSGVLIGSMTTAGSATGLIVALLVMQAAYLVAVFFQAGFVSLSVGLFTFALGVVKIANYAIAFAFLDSMNASSGVRSRSATAFIVLNSVVLIAWFARHAIMFVLALSALSQREEKATMMNPRMYQDSDWPHRFSHQHLVHAFHEEDDDALLLEMVEFQTPIERETQSAGTANQLAVASEQKGSVDAQISSHGSNVFVTMMESPTRESDLSFLGESTADARSTGKMAL